MKKILCVFMFVILVSSLLAVNAFASHENVIDTADLLTDAEETKLSEMIDSVYDTYGVDVVLLLEDTYVSDIRKYVENYYDNGGYAPDGIIFYLSVYDRDWYMCTSGTCMETLSDDRLDDIFDQISVSLGDDDYYDAMYSFVSLCEGYIGQQGDVTIDAAGGIAAFFVGYALKFFIVVPVAFLIALLIVFIEKRKMNTAVLQTNANEYIIKGSVDISESKDVFINSTITRVPISQGNGGRSGGGGGRSHGGRGGKF